MSKCCRSSIAFWKISNRSDISIIRLSIACACLLHFHTSHDGHAFRHEISTSAAVHIFSLDVSHGVICTAAEDNLKLLVFICIHRIRLCINKFLYLSRLPHILQGIVEIAHRIGERRAFLLIVCTLSLVLHHLH